MIPVLKHKVVVVVVVVVVHDPPLSRLGIIIIIEMVEMVVMKMKTILIIVSHFPIGQYPFVQHTIIF